MNRLKLLTLTATSLLTLGCTSQAEQQQPVTASHTINNDRALPSINIATWNVEHLAYPIDKGCKPRTAKDIDEMREYAESLQADIVAVQEVASEAALRQIFSEQDWQFVMSSRPDSKPYECRESGFTSTQQKIAFAIRKSIPILKVEQFSDLALGLEGLRYGLAITIDSPIGPTDILNVHMKSGCFVDDYRKSDREACQVFSKQAPVIQKWISERQDANSPYVILGDFNHRISAPYNYFSQNSLSSDVTIATQKLVGCHPRYPAPIDHIVVGGIAPDSIINASKVHPFKRMDETDMLSDHCAISTTLFSENFDLSFAVKWLKQSKEYQLLTVGVYQQALQALAQLPSLNEDWVVVMDVDETVLDNSDYQKHIEQTGQGYTPKSWDAWVKKQEATLVPGAKAFIQAVFNKGGKVALVTNRERHQDPYTWRNLQALGVPISFQNTCLIGRAQADIDAMNEDAIVNDKDLRRQQISKGLAPCFQFTKDINLSWKKPYKIVFQVGDNIEDFAGVTQHGADIEALLPELGNTLFLLPNPMYGSWL